MIQVEKGKRAEVFERDAANDLWRHTLSQIPSIFGRLVYLSSLRNPNTEAYEHHGFRQMFGEEEADRTLRDSHRQSFSDWLLFSLEEQRADLDLYVSALGSDRKTVVEAWLRLAPYRHLVPGGTRKADRALYLCDLETLLKLLRNEYGVPAPDPDA